MQRLFVAAAVTLCATIARAGAFPAPPLYPSFSSPKPAITDFDPAGSHSTVVAGIDAKDAVAGYYIDGKNGLHGFLRKPGGMTVKFDDPEAGQGNDIGTAPLAISPAGDITGFYDKDGGISHGFVRSASGKFSEFDPPHSLDTLPAGMNKAGVIAGWFLQSNGDFEHAFIRAADGTITVFDVPGSQTGAARGSAAKCINAAGAIAGVYDDKEQVQHGFLRTAGGKFSTFDPPGSTLTNVTAINSGGVIAGYYSAGGNSSGFMRTANGKFTTFSAAKGSQSTFVRGIDDAGDVTGYYVDADNALHGFVRNSNGKITTFDAPGANTSANHGTEAFAISADGTTAGFYYDGRGAQHGFVRTP